jgi:hypothetical protein
MLLLPFECRLNTYDIIVLPDPEAETEAFLIPASAPKLYKLKASAHAQLSAAWRKENLLNETSMFSFLVGVPEAKIGFIQSQQSLFLVVCAGLSLRF